MHPAAKNNRSPATIGFLRMIFMFISSVTVRGVTLPVGKDSKSLFNF
jgi:hypothetical protein